MAEHDENQEPVDPLTDNELRPLRELAEAMSLNYHSLRKYAQNGRLRAIKFGVQWASKRQWIEEYLKNRYNRSATRHNPDS
jgi:hypothetical protein